LSRPKSSTASSSSMELDAASSSSLATPASSAPSEDLYSRLKELQRDNAIITDAGEQVDISVADALDEQTPFDLVIVAVMAYQVAPLLPSLKRSAAKRILFMFNNFHPEALRDELGIDRAVFGMPFIQAHVLPDGGKLHVRYGAKTLLGDAVCADIFNAAGIPASYEPNMLLWLRCHVPLCIAFERASYAGVQRNGGVTWAQSMTMARGVHESFLLIQRMGYNLYPGMKVWVNRSPTWVVALMLFGITRIKPFRELLAGGVHEAGALIDVLLEASSQATPPVNKGRIEAMRLIS